MKKYYVSILALAALTACSNEEDFSFNPNEIRLTSAISSMTRVNSLDVQSTMIEAGQPVGVTITGAETEHNNIAWTAGTNGELTNSGEPVCWGDAGITVNAYHPHISGIDISSSFEFCVSDDQTGDGYLNSDLMFATTTSEQTTEAVALKFEHRLSKINIVLENTAEAGVDLSQATITLCNVNKCTDFQPWDGGIFNSSEPGEILAGTGTNQASAIIVPQTIWSGKKFIKLETEGKTYYYTLGSDKTFESGKVYTFKLGIRASVAISLSENVTDWTDGGTTEGNLKEYVDPVAAKSTIAFDPTLETLTLEEGQILTGNEIYVLRKMLGASEFDESERGVLHTLDMSKAIIQEGGEAYWVSPENADYKLYTENNIISERMFVDCLNLQSITLPSNVTEIGNEAFNGCYDLANITINEGVWKIGGNAFYWTALTSLILPESLTCIVNFAFAGMGNLTSITIPEGVSDFGYGVFIDCQNLTTVNVSENSKALSSVNGILYDKDKSWLLWIPSTITEYTFIGSENLAQDSFRGHPISSISFPDEIETIMLGVFFYSGLTSVKLPANLKKICNQAFQGTQLTTVTFPANVTEIGCSFAYVALYEVHCLSTIPPTLDPSWAGTKGGSDYLIPEDATLYVPAGCGDAYRASEWGNHFKNIVEE